MARRFTTSKFSARLSWILSMYGSWLPSVSTQMLYGFRSRDQFGVLAGWTVFQGETTGRSGFNDQFALNLNMVTQLSNFSAATFLSSSSFGMYFGWNCFR